MLVSIQPHTIFFVRVFELFNRGMSWPAIAKVISHKVATKAIKYMPISWSDSWYDFVYFVGGIFTYVQVSWHRTTYCWVYAQTPTPSPMFFTFYSIYSHLLYMSACCLFHSKPEDSPCHRNKETQEPVRLRPLVRPRIRWWHAIEVSVREMCFKESMWPELAQDHFHWRGLVITILNVGFRLPGSFIFLRDLNHLKFNGHCARVTNSFNIYNVTPFPVKWNKCHS
jgi:hypothetical protein